MALLIEIKKIKNPPKIEKTHRKTKSKNGKKENKRKVVRIVCSVCWIYVICQFLIRKKTCQAFSVFLIVFVFLVTLFGKPILVASKL
jgi:hypothetical protein